MSGRNGRPLWRRDGPTPRPEFESTSYSWRGRFNAGHRAPHQESGHPRSTIGLRYLVEGGAGGIEFEAVQQSRNLFSQ